MPSLILSSFIFLEEQWKFKGVLMFEPQDQDRFESFWLLNSKDRKNSEKVFYWIQCSSSKSALSSQQAWSDIREILRRNNSENNLSSVRSDPDPLGVLRSIRQDVLHRTRLRRSTLRTKTSHRGSNVLVSHRCTIVLTPGGEGGVGVIGHKCHLSFYVNIGFLIENTRVLIK